MPVRRISSKGSRKTASAKQTKAGKGTILPPDLSQARPVKGRAARKGTGLKLIRVWCFR